MSTRVCLPEKKYSGYIFDLDGTLVDSMPGITRPGAGRCVSMEPRSMFSAGMNLWHTVVWQPRILWPI